MADFDIVSKYLIQHYPDDVARFALGRDDVEVVEWLDAAQTDFQEHRPDSLLRVRLGGEAVVVHTEFQTTDSSSPPMPRRMAGYIWRAVEKYDLPVYSSVIYLRPNAGRRDPGYYLQDRPGHRILIEYRVVRLSQQAGPPVLAAGPAGLLALAPLMQPAPGQAAEAWLRQCVQAVQALPLAEPARGNLVGGLSVLSGLIYAPETIAAILSQEGIMDLIRESSFAQLLTQQAREQGLEQGREEGLEQGLEQGGRERAIEALLDVLEIRFARGEEEPLVARIRDIRDLQRLKQLHRAAIQVDSLEAFGRLLDGAE